MGSYDMDRLEELSKEIDATHQFLLRCDARISGIPQARIDLEVLQREYRSLHDKLVNQAGRDKGIR